MKTKRSLFYAALFGMIALLTFSCKKEQKPEVSLTLNKTTTTLAVGASEELTAVVVNSTEAVAWTSSNTAVATVGAIGNVCKVTAVAEGTAFVKATVAGKEATCEVKVISNQFQLQPAAVTVNVGAVAEVNAFNAEGDIQWSTDPEDATAIATVAFAGAKATITGVAEGSFKIVAKSGNAVAMSDVTVKAASTEHPIVAPTADAFTLVFKVPDGDCYGNWDLTFAGSFNSWAVESEDVPVAEPLNDPNFPGWYKLVLEISDASFNHSKVCPRKSGTTGSWVFQASNYTPIEGDFEVVDDNGRALDVAETAKSSVIYFAVDAWATDICSETNPAGPATFTYSFEVPDGINYDDITVTVRGEGVGSNWHDLTTLTYDDRFKVWSAQDVPVPEACKFKATISYKGSTGDNYESMEGNHTMPVDRNAIVEVSEWSSDPWVVVPGGEGTFKINLGELCGIADAQKVIFTGNFPEKGWGESDREMTPDNEGNWSWTGAYPANFKYKVILLIPAPTEEDPEATTQQWVGTCPNVEGVSDGDGNWIFDGETFTQSASCGLCE